MSVPFCNGRPIPLEVLEHIAFTLVALAPLGSLSDLIPLLGTSKHINNALSLTSGTSLYSRVCRLKYDVGAVARRAFTPHTKDLTEHLVHMCQMTKVFKRGDIFHEDVETYLLTAYMAMLDNDGKNRAQLEHAGIDSFLNNFVRLRLNEGREANNMWPVESPVNTCSLWLMWMFSTREKLEQETVAQRETLISLIFPFIICPYRYSCALAPPNHFILPLNSLNPVQKEVLTVQTAHGHYPVYHTLNNQPFVTPHFRSQLSFLVPLITPAAKLLFASRRELVPLFRIPVDLPANRAARNGGRGITQEDLLEFNQFKSAKLPQVVRWDWDKGYRVTYDQAGREVEFRGEQSRDWDVDWWRARVCGNVFWKQPKWKLGPVHVRGMLSGLWQGVYYLKNNTAMHQVLSFRDFPNGLSENSMVFMAQPMIMRLKEHGFVQTPTFSPPSAASPSCSCFPPSSSPPHATPIPHATPLTVPVPSRTGSPDDAFAHADGSMNNAWLPGPVGSLKWVESSDGLDDGLSRDKYVVSTSSAAPINTYAADADTANPRQMGSTKFIVPPDAPSGSEAYFGVGASPEPYTGGMGGPLTFDAGYPGRRFVYERYEKGRLGVHEKLVAACGKAVVVPAVGGKCKGGCNGKGKGVGSETSTGGTAPAMATIQSHPGCLNCAARAQFIAKRWENDMVSLTGVRAPKEGGVEDMFESIGMGLGKANRDGRVRGSGYMDRGGYIPEDGWADYEDEEDEEEVVDLDLDGDDDDGGERGTNVPGVDAAGDAGTALYPVGEYDLEGLFENEDPAPGVIGADPQGPDSASPSPTPSEDDMDGNNSDEDFERGQGKLRDSSGKVYDSIRRSHDRYRVEKCDDGVEDVVVTGELDDRHQLAWGNNVYYGRVRPWDGLIAILRVSQDPNANVNANFIMYGYIYGGNTFVGNWRYAGVDPLVPAFESCFVMSKRED